MHTKWKKRLKNVTWGYRHKFEDILIRLERDGYLCSHRDRDVEVFENLFMKMVGQSYGQDIIANEFLSSLDKNVAWVLSLPKLLDGWGSYGLKLAEEKLYYGIRYFSLWTRENMTVDDPDEMEFILTTMALIEEKSNPEISLAFLEGYRELRRLLPRQKIPYFIDQGLALFSRNPKGCRDFFLLKLSTARKAIECIDRSCYLKDASERMKRLFRSICEKELTIDNYSKLDSDELIEKGSRIVCLCNGLYLPARMNVYDTFDENLEHYLLITYLSAMAHHFKGFPVVHGLPGFESCKDMLEGLGLGSSPLVQGLFFIMDLQRILSRALMQYPGLRSAVKKAVRMELSYRRVKSRKSLFDLFLSRVLCGEAMGAGIDAPDKRVEGFYCFIKGKNLEYDNFYDMAKGLPEVQEKFKEIFGAGPWTVPDDTFNLSFFPDYRYHASLSQPPMDHLKFLDEGKQSRQEDSENGSEMDNRREQRNRRGDSISDQQDASEQKGQDPQLAGYFYNEWNNEVGDYMVDWCCLNETEPHAWWNSREGGSIVITPNEVREIRRAFERIKPDLMRRERNLLDGDELAVESLINFMVEKKAHMSPDEKIYSKCYKNQRDMATALLIDMSGSTGDKIQDTQVLELEKLAAVMLAEGLNSLGDDFGIFGFSGCGRENCRYYVFKDFNDDWTRSHREKLLGSMPDGSTRIGVAIRHTIEKLKGVEAGKKLVILITDGKPQDADGYSPQNLYAQYDVRMACLEALKEGIVVFGLSTENNSFHDLEIMFPQKRYVMIKDIRQLPKLLSKLYIKLTM